MTPPPHRPAQRRRKYGKQHGKASPALIGVVALLVLAVAGVGTLAYKHFTGGPAGPKEKITTQADIDLRLGMLQQEFQAVLQEGLDLARFESKAKLFTLQHPEEPAGHVLLAQVRMGMKDWAGAYESWVTALEDDPGAFELSKMAGFCAAKLGKYEVAEQHYTAAVKASGDQADSEVYAALGRLYLSLEDLEKAEAAFNKSLSAPAPGEKTNWKHQAHSGLADVASVRQQPAEAIAHVDRAIRFGRLDSAADLAGYHIQKARILMDAGNDEDAITALRYTWQAYPDSQMRIESARLRARLYEREDKLTSAVNHITMVCQNHQLDPKRDDVALANLYALLAKWQVKAGQLSEAGISLHNLQTLAPKHPDIDAIKASIALERQVPPS